MVKESSDHRVHGGALDDANNARAAQEKEVSFAMLLDSGSLPELVNGFPHPVYRWRNF